MMRVVMVFMLLAGSFLLSACSVKKTIIPESPKTWEYLCCRSPGRPQRHPGKYTPGLSKSY